MSLIMPALMPWLYQTMTAMAEGTGENRRRAYRDDVNNHHAQKLGMMDQGSRSPISSMARHRS